MMKTNHSIWDSTFLPGTTPKTISPWDVLEIIKKDSKIKNKKVFNWRTHLTKTFDKIKLDSQPNTSKIQRLSLSLIKKKQHFYWDSEITISISMAKMY